MTRECEIVSLQDELTQALHPFAGKPFPTAEDQILMMAEVTSILQDAISHANGVDPDLIQVEIEEEDEDMAVVREVLEIPLDTIRIKVTFPVSFLDRIVLQCRLDPETGELWTRKVESSDEAGMANGHPSKFHRTP